MTGPDRNTPRGELWWMLWDNYTPDVKEAALNAYRDQIRHEAAQEIRAAWAEQERRTIERFRYLDHEQEIQKEMAEFAADLIDPKVGP